MIFSHIVAMSKNNVIGQNGRMPWHYSEDLKRFKQMTMGHSLIMGRKTFESIGKPLSGRQNIVISKTLEPQDGIIVVPGIDQAFMHAKETSKTWGEEVFIIGGGEIYKQTLSKVQKIYMTIVQKNVEGDTFYPEIDRRIFREIERREHKGLGISFVTYVNVQNVRCKNL